MPKAVWKEAVLPEAPDDRVEIDASSLERADRGRGPEQSGVDL